MSSPEPTVELHPPDGDPDVVLLAELAGDLADGRGVPAAHRAHLADCEQCRAIVAAVSSVGAELRAEIRPMPAAVSRRLAVALAEARTTAADGDAAVGAAVPPAGVVVPLSGRHRAGGHDEVRTERRLRMLRAVGAAAASLVIVVGGGYLVVDGLGSVGSSNESADGAGAESGGDSVTSGEDSDLTAYDRTSLEAAVGDLLDGEEAVEGAGGAPAEPNVPEAAATGVDDDCLASLPVATGAALSISRAEYEGQAAIIVLFAAAGGRVQVTVVSDCTAGQPMVLEEFETSR